MREELETLSPEDNYESARKKAVKLVKHYEKIRAGQYDEAILFFKSKFMGFFNLTEKDLEIKKECGFHNPRGYANMGKFVRLTEKEIEELKQKIKDLEGKE